MFTKLTDSGLPEKPVEGQLYKILQIGSDIFHLYYGYYEDRERENPAIEPMPIYPNFLHAPKFNQNGHPFVTRMQDACAHYMGLHDVQHECANCAHYCHGEDMIGYCICPERHLA